MSDDLIISIKLPLPLDVVSALMQAVGLIYPGAQILTNSSHQLDLKIPREDLDAADSTAVQSRIDDFQSIPAGTMDDAETFLNSVRDGSFGMTPPEWLGRTFAGMCRMALDEADAENYLEIGMIDPTTDESFGIVIVRPGQKSPHKLRMEAEARAAELDGWHLHGEGSHGDRGYRVYYQDENL